MALICINPDADYAANSSVYQPESKEAIFNSLEKHTLREDFQWRLYITRAALIHAQYAEEAHVKVVDNRWKRLGWNSVLLQWAIN